MSLMEDVKKDILFFEGAMGSILMGRGLPSNKGSEVWNIERPEEIRAIHLSYLNAGANIVKCNTFGVNGLHYGDVGEYSVKSLVEAAFGNARAAQEKYLSKSSQDSYGDFAEIASSRGGIYFALDMGPCGKLLKPLGDLSYEDAVEIFAKTVRAGAKYADLILIETMNDSFETKAAVEAAKENSDLPIFVSNTYGKFQRLMTGATPEAMAYLLEDLGVSAVGLNCGLGPEEAEPIIRRLMAATKLPVFANPNAGMPRLEGEKTYYDVDPISFSELLIPLLKDGLDMAGGCCGTTPEYIKELRKRALCVEKKERTVSKRPEGGSKKDGIWLGGK